MKYIAFLLILGLTGCSSFKATFELISSADSKPLKNHRVVLYNGDVKFKWAKGTNPYPYKFTNKNSWVLDELTTDDSGLMTLEQTYDCRNIILVIGEEYRSLHISFSNNLSHTVSKDHIRIVDFIDGSTTVQGNYIYNLKNKKVTYISISGKKTESKFKYIRLKAIRTPSKTNSQDSLQSP